MLNVLPKRILPNGEIESVIFTVQNVDEQKRKEMEYQNQIIESAEDARRANMAKTEFLRRMSHDIRTPINGIMGMLNIGDHFPEDMEKQAECRKKIRGASSFLFELVNDVLDMSKMESGKIELEEVPFDLLDLLDEVVSMIEFTNVGFAYNDREDVLKDVTFTAKQGEITALIGPSGGGKTTVSRLASRFWDINKGSIKVGSMDIGKIDPETLMSLYSIVFQDVTLFNNTIMENIRIGRQDATDEEVIAAAKLAHCDKFAEKLPDGWNTMIGENGSELSGGERQRISIARAFLKDAPIILLDEATASFDVDNETMIQESLSRLIKNKTVMIIAHRMRTVADSDKIVVLKDGVVAEQGSPAELSRKNGIYQHMMETQMQAAGWKL